MPKRIMGIDAGGAVAEAAVFDRDGREVAGIRPAQQVVFPETGPPEVDAEASWCAVRAALDKRGTRPADIIGVSSAGHGNGLYAVDGAPPSPRAGHRFDRPPRRLGLRGTELGAQGAAMRLAAAATQCARFAAIPDALAGGPTKAGPPPAAYAR